MSKNFYKVLIVMAHYIYEISIDNGHIPIYRWPWA